MILSSHTRPVFIDISGDGKDDLVVGSADGKFRYFKKDNLGYTEQTGADNPFDGLDVGDYSSPTFTDVDGDGKIDLVSTAVDTVEVERFWGTSRTYHWKVFLL